MSADPFRDKLARYGLSIDDANTMVMTAVGGDNQTTTIEGRQRYGVSVLACTALPPLAHAFTHFKLHIEPLLLDVKKSRMRTPGVMWIAVTVNAR